MAWGQPDKSKETELFDGLPQDQQIRTKITWEFIVLEELRTINRLIMDAGKDFRKQNIFTLKQALDSWEQTLAPLMLLPDNKQIIEEANEEVESAFANMQKNWVIENYFLAIASLVAKKGAVIKVLANAGRYMPVFTHIEEKGEVPVEVAVPEPEETTE